VRTDPLTVPHGCARGHPSLNRHDAPTPQTLARLSAVLRQVADGVVPLPRSLGTLGLHSGAVPLDPVRRQHAQRVAAIQRIVAEHFGLHVDDLTGPRRLRSLVFPRHIAIYLARVHTGASLPQIGGAFHRDHATVLHACRQVTTALRRSRTLRRLLAALIARVDDTSAEIARVTPRIPAIITSRKDAHHGPRHRH